MGNLLEIVDYIDTNILTLIDKENPVLTKEGIKTYVYQD